ncbi:MAG: tRNA guanosine(34) transglycosylase Tgt [Candidatus Kerfeldbacteria bacterium]|nr:tRNA guanosine(34) transglycosylase Tgt [Candidatus Kerfeldbacteria bacterium]
MFEIQSRHAHSRARAGILHTRRGTIRTPFFMPVATQGVLKTLSLPELYGYEQSIDSSTTPIVLSNTYHLYLRPGEKQLQSFGGLHQFAQWPGIILTDSGGFQIFSLKKLNTLTDDGVQFQSHIDGSRHWLTPERSMEIQSAIDSDIWMSFDYFPGYPATEQEVEKSVSLTTAWAKRSLLWHASYWAQHQRPPSLLFGIVQGGAFPHLRKKSAEELTTLDFGGFAIGGLAVGEPEETMYQAIEEVVPLLPERRPRYLMGVGTPDQILQAVRRGVDMFDCVMPTRNARHGTLYTRTEERIVSADLSSLRYEKIQMRAHAWAGSDAPLDAYCACFTCSSGFSRGYLRHLYSIGDPTAARLGTIHNIFFYLSMMREMRDVLSLV